MKRVSSIVFSCLVLLAPAFSTCIIGKPLKVRQICGRTWPGSKLRLTKAQENAPTIQKVMIDEHGRYAFDAVPSGDYWLYDAPTGSENEAVPIALNVRRPLHGSSCKQPIELQVDFLPETCVSPKLIASDTTVMTTPLSVSECLTEEVKPNLELNYPTRVIGTVRDETGDPFRKSKIAIRKFESTGRTVDLKTVFTDQDGKFDLGTLDPGEYRLLASPHRGFAQPKMLECTSQFNCRMEITLKVSRTDLPYAACPIK